MHEVIGLLMYVHVQKSPLNILALIFSLYHIPFVLQPTFYFHILSPFKWMACHGSIDSIFSFSVGHYFGASLSWQCGRVAVMWCICGIPRVQSVGCWPWQHCNDVYWGKFWLGWLGFSAVSIFSVSLVVSSFCWKNGYMISLYDLCGHSLEDLTPEAVFIWPDSELAQGKMPLPKGCLSRTIRGNCLT